MLIRNLTLFSHRGEIEVFSKQHVCINRLCNYPNKNDMQCSTLQTHTNSDIINNLNNNDNDVDVQQFS